MDRIEEITKILEELKPDISIIRKEILGIQHDGQSAEINAKISKDEKHQFYNRISWRKVVIVSVFIIGCSVVWEKSVELDKLTKDNQVLRQAVAATFPSQLPSLVNGKSLNGSSFEQITAALPKLWSLVVEICNYLDTDLTNYQYHRYWSKENAKAPATVYAKTREVATFITDTWIPAAEMLYRIQGTSLSLRLGFNCGHANDRRIFGAELLPISTPFPSTLDQIYTKYSDDDGYIGARKCIYQVPFDIPTSLTVSEDNIFVKVTFKNSYSTSILSAQIFKLDGQLIGRQLAPQANLHIYSSNQNSERRD